MDFQSLYDAAPFNPDDPSDARAEAARLILIEAFEETVESLEIEVGDDLSDVLKGMTVGMACVIGALVETSDENHARIRTGMIQIVPWAVDFMRSFLDLPPLSANH